MEANLLLFPGKYEHHEVFNLLLHHPCNVSLQGYVGFGFAGCRTQYRPDLYR